MVMENTDIFNSSNSVNAAENDSENSVKDWTDRQLFSFLRPGIYVVSFFFSTWYGVSYIALSMWLKEKLNSITRFSADLYVQ